MTVTDRLNWGIDRETETATWSRMVAGTLFAALAGWFLTALTLAGAMDPDYVLHSSTISDLGVAPESALLFNGSLLLVGILTVVGGYLFYRSHGTPWLLGAFALAGLGAFGAGVFPLDFGALHWLFVLLAFLFFNLAAIGTGVRIRGPMVVVSVLLGAVGLLALAVLAVGTVDDPAIFGPLGRGGVERLVLYPAMLWLLVFGGYLLGSKRDRRDLTEEDVAE